MSETVRWTLSVSLVAAVACASLLRLAPPGESDNSPFSLARAIEHVKFIASAPHPLGSEHHRAVREYLVAQFSALGLEVQVQESRVKNRLLHGLPIRIANVIARVRGRAGLTGAVLLAAHYDSTPVSASCGAGDDGAAVAALLEVARVLSLDRPECDVIFLMTDGEELGMLGATAFVTEHPWVVDVGVVLNFEARGTSGASIMFETSPGNASLISEFASSAPHPVASSLSYDIYRMMPNNTDFTIFREAGLRGLNFAFIDGVSNYHTPGDNLANLDPRSLRHHGVQALS
ncbi:MAG: M28 family peptidase, partial [Tepidisphaeraceae bacterium]